MKSVQKILLLILIATAPVKNINAGVNNCNSFCVTNMQVDTSTNTLGITIFINDNSTFFINYPYVTLITDNNGDTLVVNDGWANFFGQFGNSSQTYEVTTTIDSLPANFNGTVFFTYGNSSGDRDTCALSYPCLTAGINKESKDNIVFSTVFPNPSNGSFTLQSSLLQEKDIEVKVYDIAGRKVDFKQLYLNEDRLSIDLNVVSNGWYMLEILSENKTSRVKVNIMQ